MPPLCARPLYNLVNTHSICRTGTDSPVTCAYSPTSHLLDFIPLPFLGLIPVPRPSFRLIPDLLRPVSTTCCVSAPIIRSVRCPKHDQLPDLFQTLCFYSFKLVSTPSPLPTYCGDPGIGRFDASCSPAYNEHEP